MAKTTALLHIGTAKTGSSTIQRFGAANREKLAEQGVLYPRSLGPHNHWALAAFAFNDDRWPDIRSIAGIEGPAHLEQWRQELQRAFHAEVHGGGCNSVLISNEHCDLMFERAEVERIKALLDPVVDEVTVFFYVRRQDEFLTSMYSTMIKGGRTQSLKVPLDIKRYDYYRLASLYAEVFGKANVRVRVFDKAEFEGGDLLADFFAQVGEIDLGRLSRIKDANQSLDVTHLEFLRQLNLHLPRMKKRRVNPARGNIVQLLERASSGPLPTLPAATLDAFMARFEESNAALAREYLHREDGQLFQSARRERTSAPMAPLSVDEAFAIFAELWALKQHEFNKLKLRLRDK